MQNDATVRGGLTPFQIALMAVFGVVGWFVAALLIQFGGPAGLFSSWAHPLLYLGTVVVWYPAFRLIKRGLKLNHTNVAAALAIGAGTAALCDGIAMPTIGWLYGSDPAIRFLGAAWLLWFVAMGLFIALIDAAIDRRAEAGRGVGA